MEIPEHRSTAVRVAKLLIAALLAGCVTAYQPHSLTGGYKDRQVGPNRHYVEFYGNGNTTRDTVIAYWLYRCAELTQEKRFDYFVLVSRTPPRGSMVPSQEPQAVPVRSPAPAYTYIPGQTIGAWTARGLIELRKGVPHELERRPAFLAKEVMDVLGPPVRQAIASGGNVQLPPRFSSADEERDAEVQRGDAMRLEDLEALLPK